MKVLDILLENDYFEKGDITDLESLLSKFNQQEFEKIIIYKNKDYLAKNFTSQDQRNRWVSRITREIGIKSQRTNITYYISELNDANILGPTDKTPRTWQDIYNLLEKLSTEAAKANLTILDVNSSKPWDPERKKLVTSGLKSFSDDFIGLPELFQILKSNIFDKDEWSEVESDMTDVTGDAEKFYKESFKEKDNLNMAGFKQWYQKVSGKSIEQVWKDKGYDASTDIVSKVVLDQGITGDNWKSYPMATKKTLIKQIFQEVFKIGAKDAAALKHIADDSTEEHKKLRRAIKRIDKLVKQDTTLIGVQSFIKASLDVYNKEVDAEYRINLTK